MEDFYETRISEVDGQMVASFGVFYGHGGSRTVEYPKNNLFKNLSSHPDFTKDTKSAIAIPLSIDHKPDRFDERERIEQAGGFIIWAGTWRVSGVLAVSRAIGDKLLKPYVVDELEIQFLFNFYKSIYLVVYNMRCDLLEVFQGCKLNSE